ncbi:hypothetical protein ACMFMF_006767 [Clarireedia jacksonii]
MPSAPHRASSHPSTTTSTTTSHPSTRTSVRRNLFQSQLSRRGGESSSSHSLSHPSQPYHRPTTSSTSTSAETLRLDIDIDRNGSGSNSGMGLESTDIVIRDKNGDFEVLAMQSLEEDDDDDMGGRGGGGGFSGRGGRGGIGEEGEDGEREFYFIHSWREILQKTNGCRGCDGIGLGNSYKKANGDNWGFRRTTEIGRCG